MLDLYEVGQRVRFQRRAAKLTQPELAKRSSMSVQYIISLTKAE
jgi:transcriptional regulator with XRE-family HTH domain